MNQVVQLEKDVMQMLKLTSRTFYIPISLLKPALKKTVASAYLCMRAIDEIEDHEKLGQDAKHHVLHSIGQLLKHPFDKEAYQQLLKPHQSTLPEVTLRLGDWISICPAEVIDKIKHSTRTMAHGMANWVRKDWRIRIKDDLDDYTYYVAGLVGVMLSDIWEWYDGTKTNRDLAVAFGRGLQAVNILRNQKEDWERGVSFFPDGWDQADMFDYAEKNLSLADEYIKDIHNRNILLFCKIPLSLAKKTLHSLKRGDEKLSRNEVEEIVSQITTEIK